MPTKLLMAFLVIFYMVSKILLVFVVFHIIDLSWENGAKYSSRFKVSTTLLVGGLMYHFVGLDGIRKRFNQYIGGICGVLSNYEDNAV